jgi:hypothetical protein
MQRALLASVLCCASATSTWGAMVLPSQGEVYINSGTGFNVVGTPTEVQVGDKVIVSPQGQAMVSFADGCNIPVGAGQILVVGQASPCAAHGLQQNGLQAPGTGATPPWTIPGTGAPGLPPDVLPPVEAGAPAAAGGISTTVLVAGGVAAIAGVAVVATAASKSGSKPASP